MLVRLTAVKPPPHPNALIISYQSIAVTDSYLALLSIFWKQLTHIMAVLDVIMKFRAAISTNLHFKMRREEHIVQGNVQLIFLTESRHFEENRLFGRATDSSLAAGIAISQVL